jgi:hypothetical protein
MDRCASVNRAVLMAYCGLFIATPIWAEPQEDPLQDEQFREDQSQIARPKPAKPEPNTGKTRLFLGRAGNFG